jgi:hypothetical protein
MVVSIPTTFGAIAAILIGILILIFPKLLRWGIAFYLILVGVVQLVLQYS